MNIFELFGSISLKGGKEATANVEAFDKSGQKAAKSVTNLEKAAKLTGKAMKVAFIGAAAAAAALTAGLTKAVKEAADLEQISTAYEVLIGDVEKAGKVIDDIKKASARTPFQFKDLAKQGQTLMAFGTEAEKVVDTMMVLGDISMGNSVKMGSIVRAYGKIQAKGKATLEELNMLTENGVPILEELSNQYGVTTEEMFKLITAGKVGFADVDQAIRSMTAEGGKFFGMLDKQSKTFSGRISTLRDNIQMLFAEVGSRLLPVLGPALDEFTSAVKTALEELTDGKGPLARFLEIVVNVVAWAVNNLPKIGRTFEYVGEVAGIVADGIKEAYKDTIESAKGLMESLGLGDEINGFLRFGVQLVGDTWNAILKGFETGDWSDLFSSGTDLAKTAITIFATVALAKDLIATIMTLFTNIISAFTATALFASVKGVGVGGVVAGIALAIAIKDAVEAPEGGWTKLIENVGAALVGGAVVGVITGNLAAGTMAFSLALNLHLGEKIGEAGAKLVESVSAGINETELEDEVYGKAEGWGIELAKYVKRGWEKTFETDDAGNAIGWGAKYEEAFREGFILDKIWEDLESSFLLNWEITSANITRKWNELIDTAKPIWDRISTDLENSWNTVVDNATSWGTSLGESVVSGIDEAKEFFIGVGTRIGDWVKEDIEAGASFVEVVIVKWNELADAAGPIWSKFSTDLESSWTEATNNATEWGMKLAASINNGIILTEDYIKKIGGKIWGWIKDGFGDAVTFAEEMIDALVEGFEKAKTRVTDWWKKLWNVEIKWNIFQSRSPPKVAVDLGEDTGEAFASGLEKPGIISRITDATNRWWQAISAPGTMDPEAIISNIFGKSADETVDELDDLAVKTETFWDRIVIAAEESGVSIATIAASWSKTFEGMIADVGLFVLETGYALGNGTAKWTDIMGAFGDIMSNTFSAIFTTLVIEIAKAVIAQNAWLATTLTNIATAITGFLAQAFAALTAFFAFLGPLAPVAAGGVIAGAIAAIAALGGMAISWISPGEASVPDAPGTPTATGGSQISEITGPTRDLLIDLLTPLARLDSLTSIGNRIYDLLDERLIPGGSGTTVQIGDVYVNGELDRQGLSRELEEILSENIQFAQAGNL